MKAVNRLLFFFRRKSRHFFLTPGLFLCVFGFFVASCGVLRPAQKSPEQQFADFDAVNELFFIATKDLMLGRYDEAIGYYESVVVLQPDNWAALYQLSRLYWAKNHLAKAIKAAEAAYEYAPDNQWVLNQYALLMDINGENEKAASLFGRLAATTRQDEEYLMKQAFSLEKAGKNREALAVFDRLKRFVGDDNEQMLLHRQKLFLKLDKPDSAIAVCQQLVDFYPAKAGYLLLLANLYARYESPAEGLALFQKADRLFPEQEEVQAALVRFYMIYEPAGLEPYLQDVILERALPVREQIDLLRLVRTAPGQDSVFHKLAREYARKLAVRRPDNIDAQIYYGMTLQAAGASDSAARQFKSVLAVQPENYGAWQQLFMLEAEQQAMDSLIRSTEQAAVFFPKDPILDYFQGFAYLRKEAYEKAIPVLEEGLSKLAPEDTALLLQFHAFLGDAYQQEGDSSQVVAHYEEALRLAPNNLMILNNYSYYLAEQGVRLQKALEMSAQTIAARPGDATFLDTYGWILYQQGRYKAAKKYLEKALQNMAPTDDRSVTLEHLGDAIYRLGNSKAALEHWKAARLAGGDSPALRQKINTKKLIK